MNKAKSQKNPVKQGIIDKISGKNIRVLFILIISGMFVFANVLKGPMFFDDEHFVQRNRYVQSLDVKEIYTSSVTEGVNLPSNFYRPNQQMVFSLIYQFAGDTPWPYHLTSILLHILNAFLIFLIFEKLKISRAGGLIAALFFLLHPVQAEAVSYISGLADPLGFCFILSGIFYMLISFEKNNNSKNLKLKAISVVFFIAAMFTKENMIVFLPLASLVFITYCILYKVKTSRETWIYASLLVALTLCYMLLKLTVFNFTDYKGLSGSANLYTQNLYIRLITFISILWEYFKLLIFPIDLYYEKPYLAYHTLFSWRALFGLLLIAILIFSAIRIKKHPRFFLGISWFFAALLPFTGILPLNAMFLEHWLYIPITGIAMLIALTYELLHKKKREIILLFIIIPAFILYGFRIHYRNEQWADVEKFYLNELKYSGKAIRIYNNLGLYYSDKAKLQAGNKQVCYQLNRKAEKYYNKAIKISDTYPQPHHNLGNIYFDEGRTQDAINEYIFALAIDPNFMYSLNKIAEVYTINGRQKQADRFMELYNRVGKGEKISFKDIQAVLISQ